MIDMKIYEYIRMSHNKYGQSIRELSARTGISRQTIRKALYGIEPQYKMAQARQKPLLDEYIGKIKEWLEADKKAPKKQRHTATRIYERLVEEYNFKGSKSNVLKQVRLLKEELNLLNKAIFIPSDPAKRTGAEVDWGEAFVYINGKKSKIYYFCIRGKYSGKTFVKVYPTMVQECFFNGHIEAFEYFDGVFGEIVYDNLTTAVKKVFKGRNRLEQTSFISFRSYIRKN